MEIEVRHLLVSGQVQGVSYRATMVKEARRLGARGWVRNLSDGRVEAWLEGDGETVARMIAWARVGPGAAHVTEVLVEEGEEPGQFSAFSQIATL